MAVAGPREYARFTTSRANGVLTLDLIGSWTIVHLRLLDQPLRALKAAPDREVVVNLERVDQLDTTGAWLIHRTMENLAWEGAHTHIVNVTEINQRLLERVSQSYEPYDLDRPHPNVWRSLFGRIGMGLEQSWQEFHRLLAFLGLVLEALPRCLVNFRRLRLTPLMSHMEQAGFNAVPIIAMINFLVGAVVTFMGADLLQQFGASHMVVNMISYGFLREFGVLLTAIMLAGRSGSAFTASIGSMKVREEIDAMRTIGIDPVEALVIPRMLALIFTLPLLTFIADISGLAGAIITAWTTQDQMPPALFLSQFKEITEVQNFWVGMIKAPFFAFVIGLIGCFQGLQVVGSAESVGRRTTTSVVEAIFTVIVLDALFSIFFLQIGWRGYAEA